MVFSTDSPAPAPPPGALPRSITVPSFSNQRPTSRSVLEIKERTLFSIPAYVFFFLLVRIVLHFQAWPPAQANSPLPPPLPAAPFRIKHKPAVASRSGSRQLQQGTVFSAAKWAEKAPCTVTVTDPARGEPGPRRRKVVHPGEGPWRPPARTEGTFIERLLVLPLRRAEYRPQTAFSAAAGLGEPEKRGSCARTLEPFQLALRSVAPFGAGFFPLTPHAVDPGWFAHHYAKGGRSQPSKGRAWVAANAPALSAGIHTRLFGSFA